MMCQSKIGAKMFSVRHTKFGTRTWNYANQVMGYSPLPALSRQMYP